MPIWGWVCLGLSAVALGLVGLIAVSITRFSRQRDRLLREGQTVVARILLAHPCLYDPRHPATFSAALVVFTLDDDNSDEHLGFLEQVCERLKGFRPDRRGDADEQLIGKALSEQVTVGEIPLRIPDRVADGRAVYFATPNVMRRMLPEGKLTEDHIYLKVLIDGGHRDLAMIDYPSGGRGKT